MDATPRQQRRAHAPASERGEYKSGDADAPNSDLHEMLVDAAQQQYDEAVQDTREILQTAPDDDAGGTARDEWHSRRNVAMEKLARVTEQLKVARRLRDATTNPADMQGQQQGLTPARRAQPMPKDLPILRPTATTTARDLEGYFQRLEAARLAHAWEEIQNGRNRWVSDMLALIESPTQGDLTFVKELISSKATWSRARDALKERFTRVTDHLQECRSLLALRQRGRAVRVYTEDFVRMVPRTMSESAASDWDDHKVYTLLFMRGLDAHVQTTVAKDPRYEAAAKSCKQMASLALTVETELANAALVAAETTRGAGILGRGGLKRKSTTAISPGWQERPANNGAAKAQTCARCGKRAMGDHSAMACMAVYDVNGRLLPTPPTKPGKQVKRPCSHCGSDQHTNWSRLCVEGQRAAAARLQGDYGTTKRHRSTFTPRQAARVAGIRAPHMPQGLGNDPADDGYLAMMQMTDPGDDTRSPPAHTQQTQWQAPAAGLNEDQQTLGTCLLCGGHGHAMAECPSCMGDGIQPMYNHDTYANDDNGHDQDGMEQL